MSTKKRARKIIASLLAVAALANFAACGVVLDDGEESSSTRPMDKTKTQIYIGNYNGGLGYKWLEDAILDFEEIYNAEHPDDQVQLNIDNEKDKFLSSALKQSIRSNRQDMYILDDLDYYDFANTGLLADITDVVVDETSGVSIESIMNDSLKNYYQIPENAGFTATGGHYYGVPFYQSFYHLIYDKDLFEENGFYLNEDGTGFIEPGSDEKRYGEEGTWNYGLPRTYSQFFMMLDHIKNSSVIPITWTGKYRDAYVPRYISTIMATYAGADNFAANFSLNGEIEVLTSNSFAESPAKTFEKANLATEKKTITTENWVDLMASQPSAYFAMKFAKDISNKDYLNVKVIRSLSETHILAQDTFLRSKPKSETKGEGQAIAMLLEGAYWMNEARASFNDIANEYGDDYSLENRNFGVMSFPVADDETGDVTPTLAANGGSVICVNQSSQHKDVVKEFIKFIHTEEQLKKFTETTYVKRPYDYTMSESEMAQMPTYVQDIMNLSNNANVVFTMPTNYKMFAKTDVKSPSWLFGSMVNSSSYKNPILDFYDDTNLTALDYYKGIIDYKSNYFSDYLK